MSTFSERATELTLVDNFRFVRVISGVAMCCAGCAMHIAQEPIAVWDAPSIGAAIMLRGHLTGILV